MAALLAMSVIHVAAEVALPKVLWWDMDVALATENLGCVAAALSKISYASYRREALTRVLRPSRVPSPPPLPDTKSKHWRLHSRAL